MKTIIEIGRKYWLWLLLAAIGIFFFVRWWKSHKLALPDNESDIATLSYLNNPAMSRAIRNNNPGNLVITGIDWDGKIPVTQNTDGKFEQFQYYWQGVRAMIKDIINDITQDGANSIRALILRYAPPEENSTNQYIDFVAEQTGFGADQKLDVDASALYTLVSALVLYETGTPGAITEPIFNYAYSRV